MAFNDCKTTIDVYIKTNILINDIDSLKNISNIRCCNNFVVSTYDYAYNAILENDILYIYCVNYYKALNIINKVLRALKLPGFITEYHIFKVRTYIPEILKSNSIFEDLRGQYIAADSINEVKKLYQQLKMVNLIPDILNYLHKQPTSIFHYIPYDIITSIIALNQF